MEMVGTSNNELSQLEDQIAQQLNFLTPDSRFVEDLRDRLVSSQVFQRRREIGAVVVSSLSIFFLGALAFSVMQLVKKQVK